MLHNDGALDDGTNPNLERLNLVAAFVAVADQLSFAHAANSIGISSSTLSRKVARLEQQLGLRLLERSTRSVALTEIGNMYYERCKSILQQLGDTDDMIASYSGEPRGLLRVSFPIAFGRRVLSDIVNEFMTDYQDIQIDATYTDRFTNLIEEGFDIVVRIGSLPDSTLIARKICDYRRRIVASPGYLRRYGLPTLPTELSKHRCLCNTNSLRSGNIWQLRKDGQQHVIRVGGGFRSDDSEVIYEAALFGSGIAIVANYMCSEAINEGRLIPVLEEWLVTPESGIYVVYSSSKYLAPKTRLLADFLMERLKKATWLQM